MSAREEILASIRRELGDRRRPVPGPDRRTPLPGRPEGLGQGTARLERFRHMLEAVGGEVHAVAGVDEARSVLRDLCSGARQVALSNSPLVRELAAELDAETFLATADRARLLESDVGLSEAQYGIAETGTLCLVSDREHNREVSLVPPVHVAVLHADAVLPHLGDALEATRGSAHGEPPPLITFVTGPSRTADIELSLVIGVHGPEALHVLLIESTPT